MCSPSLLPSRLMITCLPYSLRSAVKCLDQTSRNIVRTTSPNIYTWLERVLLNKTISGSENAELSVVTERKSATWRDSVYCACTTLWTDLFRANAFARQLPAVNRNYRSLGFRDDYGLAGHFHPLQSNCFHQHPAISMFSLKNLKNFSPSWPGHHRPITFAHKGVGEKPAKKKTTH